MVWGKGARACVGQYMATMELKILLARLIDRFEISLRGDETHEEMEMTDHFVIVPKGQRCSLVFTEV